jgi:hypothetical protein
MPGDKEKRDTLFQVDGTEARLAGHTFQFERFITDPEQKAAAREMFIEAVTEGLRAHCRLPIDGDEAQQMRFFFDGLKGLGKGDVHTGMEVMFDDIKAVQGFRARFSRVAERVGTAVIISIMLGMFSLLSVGAWFKLKG